VLPIRQRFLHLARERAERLFSRFKNVWSKIRGFVQFRALRSLQENVVQVVFRFSTSFPILQVAYSRTQQLALKEDVKCAETLMAGRAPFE
jgi:hypothetical protein